MSKRITVEQLGIKINPHKQNKPSTHFVAQLTETHGTTRSLRLNSSRRATYSTLLSFPCYVQPQHVGLRCIGEFDVALAMERFMIKCEWVNSRLAVMARLDTPYEFAIINKDSNGFVDIFDMMKADHQPTDRLAIVITDLISDRPASERVAKLNHYLSGFSEYTLEDHNLSFPVPLLVESPADLAKVYNWTLKRRVENRYTGIKLINQISGYNRERGSAHAPNLTLYYPEEKT